MGTVVKNSLRLSKTTDYSTFDYRYENRSRQIVSGSKALALGIIHSNVHFATCYPGNPATDIFNYLLSVGDKNITTEWCVNEKIALENAASASISGLRSVCVMKHYGMNVAADFISSLSVSDCCIGGMLILVGDDPGGHASRSEQDSRHYGKMFNLPVLEPIDIEQAVSIIPFAFELSERLAVPVIVRSVTRFLHSSATIEYAHNEYCMPSTPYISSQAEIFSSPAINYHRLLLDKISRCKDIYSVISGQNYVKKSGSDTVIIATGRAYLIAKEAVSKLGMDYAVDILPMIYIWPLCEDFLLSTLPKYKRIIFMEEVDPFVEDNVMALIGRNNSIFRETKIYGKADNSLTGQSYPGVGELEPNIVLAQLRKIFFNISQTYQIKDLVNIGPTRITGNLCPGCSHRSALYALDQAKQLFYKKVTVIGDIGCYTMGIDEQGYNTLNAVFCMGASISVASGLAKLPSTDHDQTKFISVIGDSSFIHAGLPALIDVKNKNTPILCIILDNSGSAMTGGQDTYNFNLEKTSSTIENFLKSIDIRYETINPYEMTATVTKILDYMVFDEPAVLVIRAPCLLKAPTNIKTNTVLQINSNKCTGAGCGCNYYCIHSFKCPAIIMDKSNPGFPCIDQEKCIACGACIDICPSNAINYRAH